MSEKISQYIATATSNPIKSKDYLDLSNEDGTGGYDVSKKVKVSEMMIYINTLVNNIYNSNGNQVGNRTITSSGLSCTWDGGTVITKSDGINDNGFLLFDSLNVLKGGIAYDVSLSSVTMDLKNAGGSYFLASDGKIAQNAPINASIQHYLVGDGSSYGFRVDGTNTSAHYASSGGGNLAAFYCFNFNAATGVWIEGNPAVTAPRVGGRFHLYGSNTSANTALSLRAENGVNDMAVDVISGSVIMRSGFNYSASGTATQKGSDGNITFQSALWDGASAVSKFFKLRSLASVTVDEETELDFDFDGSSFMKIKSSGTINMSNLPTSSVGLVAGDIWNNSGVLNIV